MDEERADIRQVVAAGLILDRTSRLSANNGEL